MQAMVLIPEVDGIDAIFGGSGELSARAAIDEDVEEGCKRQATSLKRRALSYELWETRVLLLYMVFSQSG